MNSANDNTYIIRKGAGIDNFSNAVTLLTTGEKKLTLGFLGGSITLGTSSKTTIDGKVGDYSLSWVNQTSQWFKDMYPDATIETVNSGVSDTATNYGLFRLRKTLMNTDGHDMPDVVFVEFTNNDIVTPNQTTADLATQIESLFRNIWQLNPNAQIVAVSTLRYDGTSVSAYRSICSQYGVQFIDVGTPLGQLMSERGHSNESSGNYYYTVDNLHPSHIGYTVYTNVIKEQLGKVIDNSKAFKDGKLYDFTSEMPESSRPLILNPTIIPASELPVSGDATVSDSPLTASMFGTQTDAPQQFNIVPKMMNIKGEYTVTVDFEGSCLGLLFMMNSNAINVKYSVDGGEEKTFAVDSNNYSWQLYTHGQTWMLEHNLSKGTHTVTFTFSGNNIDLAAILTNGK